MWRAGDRHPAPGTEVWADFELIVARDDELISKATEARATVLNAAPEIDAESDVLEGGLERTVTGKIDTQIRATVDAGNWGGNQCARMLDCGHVQRLD